MTKEGKVDAKLERCLLPSDKCGFLSICESRVQETMIKEPENIRQVRLGKRNDAGGRERKRRVEK